MLKEGEPGDEAKFVQQGKSVVGKQISCNTLIPPQSVQGCSYHSEIMGAFIIRKYQLHDERMGEWMAITLCFMSIALCAG